MIAFVLIATAGLIEVGCAALSWAHFARVSATKPHVASELALSLKRVPREDRISALARLAPPSTWPHRAACEMIEEASDPGKVAALNDVLRTVEHDLVRGAAWPGAAVRVAMLGAALPAVVAYLANEPEALVPLFALGLTGAVFSAEIGRRARRLEAIVRAAADDLSATVAGHLEPPATLARERCRSALRPRSPR